MTFFGNLGQKIGDKITEIVVGRIPTIISGAVLITLGSAWLWIWHHFDPQFDYGAITSSLNSDFISLAQPLSQIEKDSHRYCNGGWDQRIAKLGLRRCYHFTFNPDAIYNITVCTHDQRTAQVSTTDQLIALRYFERRFAPLECFRTVQQGDARDYEIVAGKDAHIRKLRFSNDDRRSVAFCGCSAEEEREIVRVIGAVSQ